jgi:hypothetical protein
MDGQDKNSGQPGAAADLETARIVVPAIWGIVYGVYAFTKYGTDVSDGLRTYVAVVGGVAAVIGAFISFALGRFSGLFALTGLLPWLYGVYITLFLGAYGIYLGFTGGIEIFSILGSVAWVIIGWDMSNKITAAVNNRSRRYLDSV